MQVRLEAIKNQLQVITSSQAYAITCLLLGSKPAYLRQPMSAHKSPVTCHVLIASTGIPGKNVAVKIEKLDQATADFKVLSTSYVSSSIGL